MSRTSEYRKPPSVTRQGFDPGSQIVVTVESVFDGGIIAFFQDSTGNEYRGALLGVDKTQTFGPSVLKNCSEIANPLTVIHDHNYHHQIKESVLQVTRAVPSQVLLSWGSLPKLAPQDEEEEGTAVHGLASREHKRVPVDYNTKSAEVWSRPPPQPAATNHELWVPSTITNSFSRAAKSSALYKIGVSIRNQQRPNRKRKLFTPNATQSNTSAALLTPINNSQQINCEDSQSIASDDGSLSSSYSSSSQTSSEIGARPLKEFSLKVPKLELNK